MATFKTAVQTEFRIESTESAANSLVICFDSPPATAGQIFKKTTGANLRKASKKLNGAKAVYTLSVNDADLNVYRAYTTILASAGAEITDSNTPTVQPKAAGGIDFSAATTKQGGQKMGWLSFWTIPNGVGNEQELKNSARLANIPQWMIDRIHGRSAKSAWIWATQLGAKGRPSDRQIHESETSKARYLTRDIESGIRLIIREITLPDDTLVRVDNVAAVVLNEGGNTMRWDVLSDYNQLSPETQREASAIMDDISSQFSRAIGSVAKNHVRQLLLDWLNRNNRVCVRGTGGVYFIPAKPVGEASDKLERDLTAISNWVNGGVVSGVFNAVEMFNTPSTTTGNIAASASNEIMLELEKLASKLGAWEDNAAMNAGSVSYSTGVVLDNLRDIEKRMEQLQSVLDSDMGTTRIMLDVVLKKATGMRKRAKSKISGPKQSKANPDGLVGTAKQRRQAKGL